MKKILLIFLLLISFLALPPVQNAQSMLQLGFRGRPVLSSFPLDNVSETPVAAYSTRRLKLSYSGPALRVIRLSDSAQFDLATGFTKANADAISIPNDLEVIKFYDQSGNGRDVIFAAAHRPKPNYLSRSMIDFGDGTVNGTYGVTAGSVTVSAPKIFIASDTPLNGGDFVSFDDGLKFRTYVSGQKYAQGNGSVVSYASNVQRGGKQISFYFQSGNDAVRRDSVDKSYYSGSDAGDTAVSGVLRIGGYDSSFLSGNLGEIIIFDGAVDSAHRNYLESNQQAYFLDGNRLIVHGDSLGYGVGLTLDEEEFKNYGAVARGILGEGWDVYRRASPGYKLTDLIPEIPTILAPLFRSTANSNIILLNSGWNDNFTGSSATTIKTNFIAYGDAVKANASGLTRIAVSSLPKANYATQPAEYPTVRADVNAWNATHYFFFANKYINLTANTHIGDSGDTTNLTYYTADELHLAAGGYNEWGIEVANQIVGINTDTVAPGVPANLTAGTITDTTAPMSWDVVSGGDLGGYRVQISKQSDFSSGVTDALVLAGTLSTTFTGLESDGVTYYVHVAAIDTSGNYSAWSANTTIVTAASATLWAQILGTYQACTVDGVPSGAFINDIYGTSWQDIAARTEGKIKYTGGYFQKIVDTAFPVRFGVSRGSLFTESVYVATDGSIYENSSDTTIDVPSIAPGDVIKFELDASSHIVVKHADASTPTSFTTIYTTTYTMSNTTSNPVQFFLGARGDATSTTVYTKPTFVP